MASVSVLYIEDSVVGPHLELLRNICDPGSRSRPHVTVRYFDKVDRTRQRHLATRVDYIDLVEPGAFGLQDASPGASRVVFIRCESDCLEALEHKPDFPASEFHITLYDGKSADFANRLLALLRQYQWRFRLQFPYETTLTEIELKSGRSPRALERAFSPEIQGLFHAIASKNLTGDFITHLSPDRRLKYARSICDHLAGAIADFPQAHSKYSTFSEGPREESDDHSQDSDAQPGQFSSDATAPSIHVTPPELAEDMASYAVSLLDPDVSPVAFGDPAVGVGAFYQAVRGVLPPSRLGSAIGIDVDPLIAGAARRRWESRGLEVISGDFLHMEKLPPRDLIVANPPYLRHQHIAAQYKCRLRERASVVSRERVSARSGLYVYFMLLSHAWMNPGAVSVWLVPSEFMRADYGAALRHYLTRQVELVSVHQFAEDDPQFERIMVLPAVVAFRNRLPAKGHSVRMTEGGTLLHPESSSFVSIDRLSSLSTWNSVTLDSRASTSTGPRIGDLFEIKRGLATGANRFFIMERQRAQELGIPEAALRPVLPKVRQLPSDIVRSAEDGYPLLDPQLSLLDFDLEEPEIAAKYPALAAYLASGEQQGVTAGSLVRARRPWYRQERRAPAPFLCTYMGRGSKGVTPIRFIWNQSAAVVTNTYLMMYPRPALVKALDEDPRRAAELFDILRKTAKGNVSDTARRHAGGLRKIEPSELESTRLDGITPWLAAIAAEYLKVD